jgi:hypothetical protein
MIVLTGLMLLVFYRQSEVYEVEYSDDEVLCANILFLMIPILIIIWVYFYWWLQKKNPVIIVTTVHFETEQKNTPVGALNRKIFNITGKTEMYRWPNFDVGQYNYVIDDLLNTYTCLNEDLKVSSKQFKFDNIVSCVYVYTLTSIIFITPVEYAETSFTGSTNAIIQINTSKYALYSCNNLINDMFSLLPLHTYVLRPVEIRICIYGRYFLRPRSTLYCDGLVVEIRDSMGESNFGNFFYYLTLTIIPP